jgi:DNA (cytosine-5)-methyltransferase 1
VKILNLYAGIGGNRKNWSSRHDVTAVEINEEIAEVYSDFFPQDDVVVGDAHEYLKENFREFDFIWSSPPCPSHSRIRRAGVYNEQYDAKFPDMKLWQEIIFLEHYFEGDWVVENVESFYRQPVKPQRAANHYFWSNFTIPEIESAKQIHNGGNVSRWEELYGFDLSCYSFESVEKRKVLRNCVHPEVGEAILDACGTRQQSLKEVRSSGE